MEYKWEILKHEIVFQGYFRLQKYSLKHEKYEGDWTGELEKLSAYSRAGW